MADVTVTNCGSIVQFRLHSKAAQEWVEENVQTDDWQWFGRNCFNVDHRYAGHLAEGMADAGLEL
jgi:hypothetical protein